MRNKISQFTLFFSLLTFLVNFQAISKVEEELKEDERGFAGEVIHIHAEQMPEFKGGNIALRKWIATNTKYPLQAKKERLEGTVFYRFEVTKEGKIGKVELQRGVHPILDEEAKRVLKSLPDFSPGKKDGIPVNIWYSMPITFKL